MYQLLSQKKIAKDINDMTFTDYYYRLSLLARTAFEWINLPEGMDEKWIERFLFTEGSCMFYKHPTYGYMVTKCAAAGNLNFYDEPTLLHSFGTNFDGGVWENGVDCVLIRNNDDMIPTAPTIQLYAMRLADITRTMDVNINAQKTPVVIVCSDKQRMSMKQVFAKWDGNEPVIYGDKNLDINSITTLNTEAPIVFDKLQLQKHTLMNEALTFIGINNANIDKKERLVAAEVQANNEEIGMSGSIMLKAREKACELINQMFGLNIQVKFREADVYSDSQFLDMQHELQNDR